MDELLKKLLAADVLTEEVKKDIQTAFAQKITEAETKARQDATAAVTASLNEKWITERDTLIEALDAKVSEVLKEELTELKEDIERFRDLEAEYAEKLVESKGAMATELKKDITQLVEKLDAFLEIRLASELEELREDITEEKKKKFGQKVFEAFVEEFKKHYASDDSAAGKLNETEQQLRDTLEQLEASEKKNAKLERAKKLETVLQPLSGRAKEVMEAILGNVDTLLLDDAYKTYVGRVLKETTPTDDKKTSEKEEKVLAEGDKKKEVLTGVVKTGSDEKVLKEQETDDQKNNAPKLTETEKKALQKLAGIQK